jgi:predicted nuclease of predicted toxin-antitoxin system
MLYQERKLLLLHKILADENLDFRIVKRLRQEGYEVISILEDYRSIMDREVLEISREFNALLMTEDNDFGEWIFSHKEKTTGVIFLRYASKDIYEIINTILNLLNKYDDSLFNKFTVVTVNKIRIRDIT